MQLDEYRRSVDEWLDEHHTTLMPSYEGTGSMHAQMAQLSKVRRILWDAGWLRWGWPEGVGGSGGSTLLRAYLGETLTARDLVEPGYWCMPDVLVPTFLEYAPADLAATMVPRYLSGEEEWCQGFSEPGAGSNLGSLSCRAVRTDEGWRVNGQKVWTSLAQFASRCFLLTRTGSLDSAHRGITVLFVDMDSPGITVHPIEAMHGTQEFSEVFFDDVSVPFDRTIGEENHGWSVAMDLLPYERSTALWHRGALLHRRLRDLVVGAPPGSLDPDAVGEVTQLLYAFRARSHATQHRLDEGDRLGPETSIDKVLLAGVEQSLFDLVAETLAIDIAMGDDAESERWRTQYLYSRAATIYGGSAEIQRNIIARRLLDLGSDR